MPLSREAFFFENLIAPHGGQRLKTMIEEIKAAITRSCSHNEIAHVVCAIGTHTLDDAVAIAVGHEDYSSECIAGSSDLDVWSDAGVSPEWRIVIESV